MNYIVMNLKRMLRRKINLIFMLAAPFLLVTFASVIGSSSFDINISYIDNDKSMTSQMLIERLGKIGSVNEVSAEEVDIDLINADHDVAVIIEAGFEEEILSGGTAAVSLKSIQGANVSFPVAVQVDSFVSSAVTIAKAAGYDAVLYRKVLGEYNKSLSGVKIETVRNLGLRRVVTRMSAGFLFMNMLFLASQASSVLVDDKRKKLYYRIFAGPVKNVRYMFDNITSFYIVMLVQIIVIMSAMFGIYGMYYGDSLFAMFLLFAVFGLFSVAFGTTVNIFSKTPSQTGMLSSLIITPISMLGGFFWDIGLMPDFLQKISHFLPTSWGINAVSELLEGGTLETIASHIAVLFIFTAGLFAAASLKKADISV